MKSERIDKYLFVIKTLGEKKISELYSILRSEKISLVTLIRIMKKNKISALLRTKKTIAKIAKENGVSEMTVYRMLRKHKKKKINKS